MMEKYFPGIYLSFVWIDGCLPHYGRRLEFIIYPPFYFPAHVFTEERNNNLLAKKEEKKNSRTVRL